MCYMWLAMRVCRPMVVVWPYKAQHGTCRALKRVNPAHGIGQWLNVATGGLYGPVMGMCACVLNVGPVGPSWVNKCSVFWAWAGGTEQVSM